jgi:hypothetical protein
VLVDRGRIPYEKADPEQRRGFQNMQPGRLRYRASCGCAALPGRPSYRSYSAVPPKRQVSALILAGIPFLVVPGLLAGLWLARSGARQKR